MAWFSQLPSLCSKPSSFTWKYSWPYLFHWATDNINLLGFLCELKHVNTLTQDLAPKKSSSLCHFITIMLMCVVSLNNKLNQMPEIKQVLNKHASIPFLFRQYWDQNLPKHTGLLRPRLGACPPSFLPLSIGHSQSLATIGLAGGMEMGARRYKGLRPFCNQLQLFTHHLASVTACTERVSGHNPSLLLCSMESPCCKQDRLVAKRENCFLPNHRKVEFSAAFRQDPCPTFTTISENCTWQRQSWNVRCRSHCIPCCNLILFPQSPVVLVLIISS